jgi:putative PIN family toxin of toxin-antitoxin system
MKIVLDTNVILSALITQGLSSRVFDICIDKHHLYISNWIINEVASKLIAKFKIPNKEIDRVIDFLNNAFMVIDPFGEVPNLCKDKDDNNVLHLAKFIKAHLIITGDKELLKIKKIEGCKIINPRTFIEKYHTIN